MKRFKRLTTLMVALSMIFSLVQMPMSVNAAMGTGVTDKAKLKLVLLTPDELQTTGSAVLAKPNPNATGTYGFTVNDSPATAGADLQAGDTIYIGIQAEGLKNIAEYKDNCLGVSQISTGITYNKEYVTPYGGNIGRNATYLRKLFEDPNDFSTKYYFYHLDADNNIYYDYSDTTLIEAESTIKYQTTWKGTEVNISTTYVPNNNDLLYIMLFTLETVPPKGTKLFDFKDDTESHTLNYGLASEAKKKNYQLLTGTSITQPANPDDDTDIRNVLEFDASGAHIYPADAATQTGIAVTTDGTFSTTLKDMQDVKGITAVTKTMSDSSKPAITDYKLYYGPNNGSTEVSASKSTLANFTTDYHEIKTSETDVWQNGVPVAANGEYLYVVAGDYVWNLGQLNVTATAINAIKGVSGEQPAAGETLYTGDQIVIPAGTTKVTVGYDNGKDKELSKTDADAAGLKFYRVDDNSGTEALTEIASGVTYQTSPNQKLTIKKDTIRLSTGEAPNVKDYYEVPVTYNKVTLAANSGSELTEKYNAGDTIGLSKVKVDAKKRSDAAATTLTYGADGQTFTDAGIKIVIIEPAKAASKADLYSATGVTSSTQITQAMIDGGYKVVAVAANDKADNVSFVELGTIAAKAGDQYEVDGTLALAGSTAEAKTYPNAVLDLTSATVKVTNADDTSRNKTIALTAANVTSLSIVTKGATPAADTVLQASVDATTKIKPAWAGKSLKIVVDGKTLYATIPTVTKKTLTLTFSGTVADRTYNGKTDKTVPAGITAALPTTNGVETGDTAPTVPAITYTYADGNAADNKAITAAINAGATTEFDNYIVALPTGGATGITGNIKPKEVNPTLVVTVTQNPAQDTDYTLTNAEATVSGTSPFGTDKVTVKVSGTIDADLMKTEGSNKAVTSPTYTLDGDDKGNYTLGSSTAVTATVSNLPTATALKDTTAIDNAIAKYNNIKAADDKNTEENLITNKADLPTTGKVTAGGTDYDVNISWTVDKTFTPAGTTYTYTATVTPKDPTEVIVNINPAITKTVEVKASTGKPAATDFPDVTKAKFEDGVSVTHESLGLKTSGKITVDGKDVNYTVNWDPITLDATQANATQTFNGTLDFSGAQPWFTAPTGEDLKVTQKVTIAPDAKADKIKDDADNKKAIELIKNGVTLKANDPANTDIDALIAKLPKTITVVDNKGNDHTLDIEWAADKAFNIKGDTYTVTPTLKVQDGDSLDLTGFAPADIKAATIKVTPIHVKPIGTTYGSIKITQGKDPATAIKFVKSGDTTDDPDVKAEFTIDWTPEASTLDTSKAGNSQIFTGTVKIDETEYPWLSYPVDKNGSEKKSDTLTVTVQKKSTGGGGGGSSVSLSLSAASAKGVIGDKVKIDATIKGSTLKPTWKSSNEKVATVDDQGNIVMVGEGTATVTVTVAGVSKTVKVTVGKPEATPTPTPTAKPTDAPVIPDNYLKPYVSGYDEGDFRPENAITRAELATMIAKLAYGDDLPDGVYDASFWDVESDAWYNKYIGYLENLNILNGYDEGDFRPNNLISRGEICAVIARAQKFDIIPYEGIFTDVTEDDWAKDYIQTLASMNIATGYEGGSFGPYNSLIRAEAVTIINRLLAPSEPIVTWTPWDISGHWAEADIMLAANERKLIGADEPAPEATPEATPEAAPEATPTVAPEMDPNAKLDVTPEATPTAEPTAAPAK